MARTKQWPSKKRYVRPDSDDSDAESDDSNNNLFNQDGGENYNASDEETKEENPTNETKNDSIITTQPLVSADYLGPPRKPLNAFYFFKVDEFDATRAANPTLTMMEVIDVIGQKWGDLDQAKKAQYQEKYKKHQDLYQESLKPRVWKPPVLPKTEQQIASTSSTEIVKAAAEPPKRPVTAYFLYVSDVKGELKKEHPEMKATEITKMIANQWKEMDAEAKKTYEERAAEGKQKYEQEMKDYNEKYGVTEKKKRVTRHSSDEEDDGEEKEEAKSAKASLKKSKKV